MSVGKTGLCSHVSENELLSVNLGVVGRTGTVPVCVCARAKLDFSFGWAAGTRDREATLGSRRAGGAAGWAGGRASGTRRSGPSAALAGSGLAGDWQEPEQHCRLWREGSGASSRPSHCGSAHAAGCCPFRLWGREPTGRCRDPTMASGRRGWDSSHEDDLPVYLARPGTTDQVPRQKYGGMFCNVEAFEQDAGFPMP